MRTLFWLVFFLVVAGISHVAATFAFPRLTTRDAFSRLEAEAPLHALTFIPEQAARQMPYTDPAFALAVCRYDLGGGPLRLRVPLSETFLAVVFAERHRGIFASVSDRAATGGSLDVVLATPAQLERIARLDEEDQAVEEVRIAAARTQGLAIIKVFVDRPSGRERAEAVLRDAQCTPEVLPD
jgi:uncharacterized membrane protein